VEQAKDSYDTLYGCHMPHSQGCKQIGYDQICYIYIRFQLSEYYWIWKIDICICQNWISNTNRILANRIQMRIGYVGNRYSYRYAKWICISQLS